MSRADLPGQLDLPQTAPASITHRGALAPLRPTKPQKPCDHGLFSDEQMQIDLEEILG